MNLVTPEQAKDLVSLKDVASQLGADVVIIGATAYRAFMADSQRFTEDIDVVVALDLDEFSDLENELTSRGWSRRPGREQRWTTPNGSLMDILPAGPQLRATGELTWPRVGSS